MSEHDGSRQIGVLSTAAWLGLVAGLGEALWFAGQVHLVGEPVRASQHTLWMCAVSNGILFTLLGAGMAVAHALLPRLLPARLALGLLSALWGWSVLRGAESLHVSAQLTVAVGIGVVVARLVGPRLAALARRTTLWLAAVVIALYVGVHAYERSEELSARSEVEAPSEAPNVLLIVLDTVRAKSLSLHGYERATSPRLDQLARQGVVFDRCVSTAPWTLPAHASMFTGRYPHEQDIGWEKPLDRRWKTLAEVLVAKGYATGGFVGNLLYCGREFGLSRGFGYYRDYPRDWTAIAASSSLGHELLRRLGVISLETRNDAPTVVGWFTDWLDTRPREDRPFFAFLNLFDAHALYRPPEQFRFGPVTDVLKRGVRHRFAPEEMQVLVDAYDGCIKFADYWVGEVLDELERRGMRDDTLVIVTSDHGEQLGEHGLTDHGNSLYRPLLHVPLVISYPARVPRGERIAQPVTLRDLPATVLGLLGLSDGEIPGSCLANHWEGGRVVADESPILAAALAGIRTPPWFPNTAGALQSVTAEGMHLIRNGDGTEELFDLVRDPEEKANVIDTPRGREVSARLRPLLPSPRAR